MLFFLYGNVACAWEKVSVNGKFCCVGLSSAVTVGFLWPNSAKSTLKEMPSILAVELCLCCLGRITVENICSGEPAMLIAGPVVCREKERGREKEREQPLMPKATCFCFNNVLFSKSVGGRPNPRTECLKVLYFDFPCCPVEANAKALKRLMWNMGWA